MTRALAQLASHLRREPNSPAAGATDRELLTRFLREQDEAAFEELVARHARLVGSAIAKVLTDPHDTEDAFQATFLILVRRAKSIDWRTGVGPWLYGVAHRVAVKARDASVMRARKEKTVRVTPGTSEAPIDLSWREACALLHAELDKLPDRYRLPLLLCYLEGKTRDEAAAALNVSAGTVKGRLERGREVLRDRLARRGVVLSVGLLAALGTGNAIAGSPAISAVLNAVRGDVPSRVLQLTRESAMSTVLAKFSKSVIGALGFAAVASALLAAGAAVPTNATDENRASRAPQPAVTKPTEEQKVDAKPAAFVVNVVVKKPDGKPAVNASVSVWAERKQQATGKTGADGRIALTVPTFFPKVVAVAVAEGFAPDWLEFGSALGGKQAGTPTILTLQEDSVALEGRVTDLEGRAVASLPVEVERIGRPKPGKTLDDHVKMAVEHRSRGTTSLFDLDSISAEAAGLTTRLTTDKDGKFKLTGVGKDRSVRLTTRGETTEHFQVRVVTRAIDPKLEQHGPFGLHGAKFTLRIGPSRPIVGTVSDAKTGAGVPGMKIAELFHYLCETTTDKDGKFRLVGVPKAPQYAIGTGSLGAAPYFDKNLRFDDPQGLGPITADLKVRRGTVATGRVTDAGGKPVAGRIFYHWAEDNPHRKEVESDTLVILSNWGHFDRDGRYKLLVIPGPGAIGVCASPEDAFPRVETEKELNARGVQAFPSDAMHAVAAANFDPKDPKTLTHEFTLKAGRARSLVIRGAGGKLPEKLLAVGQGETQEPQRVTGDTLKLSGLAPKRGRAVVLIDDAKTVGAVAAVTGDDSAPVIVTLEKLGAVSGRLFDADGNVAVGAEVRGRLLLDRAKYDNLPDEVFATLGVFGIEPGSWQRFTSRATKTDKDGRFVLAGLLPGQEYYLVAGFNVEKRGGERLYQRNGAVVKPGATTDLGDLNPKKK